MSLDDYQATVDFRQDDVEAIVGLRAGKRREVISAWLRLERWTLAARKASARSAAAQKKLVELRAAASAVVDVLSDAERFELVERIEQLRLDASERRSELRQIEEERISLGDVEALKRDVAEIGALRRRV